MKITLALICFCVAGGLAASIPEEPKYCTDDKDPDFRLKVGQQGPSPKGSCMLVKCENVVEGKSVVTAIGCGVFMLSPGCKPTGYDNTKPYPDCCPAEICENSS